MHEPFTSSQRVHAALGSQARSYFEWQVTCYEKARPISRIEPETRLFRTSYRYYEHITRQISTVSCLNAQIMADNVTKQHDDEQEGVEVHITLYDDDKGAPPLCRTSDKPLAELQAEHQATGVKAGQQDSSRWFLWLLFGLGWLLPPCWWLGACMGSGYFSRQSSSKKQAPSQRAAWRACLAMTIISTVVLATVLSAHFTTPAGMHAPGMSA